MTATPRHIPGAQGDPLAARVAALEKAVAALGNKTPFTVGPGGSVQLPAGGAILDGAGDIILSADALSGTRLSTPFLAIPAVAKWDGNDGAAVRTGGAVGDYVFQAAHCTAETTLWTGVIPQVVHPDVLYSATIGRVTGTTSTPTYRLYVNGSVVDTKTTATYAGYGSPLRSITSITSFNSQGVPFSLTVQADITSTDYFACTFSVLAMCGN